MTINPSLPMNHPTSPQDWLHETAPDTGLCCVCEPPGPISGPIEPLHHPDLLLSAYRDEARWSAGIIAWSMDHPIPLNPPETEEE